MIGQVVTVRYVGRTGDDSFVGPTVVIDVFRAFSTAAWAFHGGAELIVLVAAVEEALELKAATPGMLAFADGVPRPGFDLFNSPGHLLDLDVHGRAIVQRTTAGTQGAVASRHSSPLLCTGFLTAAATVQFLLERPREEVCFVVTGGDEDLACAEHLTCLLRGEDPGAEFVERARRSDSAADLSEGFRKGYRGVDQRDVEMCLELDRLDFAMLADTEGDHIVLRASRPRGR
jgi:2-phosphosulfolactate phosphatase